LYESVILSKVFGNVNDYRQKYWVTEWVLSLYNFLEEKMQFKKVEFWTFFKSSNKYTFRN
jgi:hypothetical protein